MNARSSCSSAAIVVFLTACASVPDGATGPAYVPRPAAVRKASPFASEGDVRVVAHAGTSRWRVLTEPVPPQYASDQAVKVAWWDGTAGIGMFLVELHQFVTGVAIEQPQARPWGRARERLIPRMVTPRLLSSATRPGER
jgi:hypothetical protein